MRSSIVKRTLEIVGGVSLVVTLLLLGYEIRRANDVAEIESTLRQYELMSDFQLVLLADRELLDIFDRGLENPELLAETEQAVFSYQLTLVYNIYEVMWKSYENGTFSEEDADFRFAELCRLIKRHPRRVKAWKGWRSQTLLPGFREHLDKKCNFEAP